MKCMQEGDRGRQNKGNQPYTMCAREVRVPTDLPMWHWTREFTHELVTGHFYELPPPLPEFLLESERHDINLIVGSWIFR